MSGIESDSQLKNTLEKLDLLDRHILEAKARSTTPEAQESVTSLVRTANQLREEIIRYRSRQARRAS